MSHKPNCIHQDRELAIPRAMYIEIILLPADFPQTNSKQSGNLRQNNSLNVTSFTESVETEVSLFFLVV